jgi:hypothetical protein
MRTIEVFYDTTMVLTIRGKPSVLLHYITTKRKDKVYVAPIGAIHATHHYRKSSDILHPDDLPRTHKMDVELLPLLPAWVPVEMGKQFNETGSFR